MSFDDRTLSTPLSEQFGLLMQIDHPALLATHSITSLLGKVPINNDIGVDFYKIINAPGN